MLAGWCVVVCGFDLRLLVLDLLVGFGGCLFKLFSCWFEYCLDWYWLVVVIWWVVLGVVGLLFVRCCDVHRFGG